MGLCCGKLNGSESNETESNFSDYQGHTNPIVQELTSEGNSVIDGSQKRNSQTETSKCYDNFVWDSPSSSVQSRSSKCQGFTYTSRPKQGVVASNKENFVIDVLEKRNSQTGALKFDDNFVWDPASPRIQSGSPKSQRYTNTTTQNTRAVVSERENSVTDVLQKPHSQTGILKGDGNFGWDSPSTRNQSGSSECQGYINSSKKEQQDVDLKTENLLRGFSQTGTLKRDSALWDSPNSSNQTGPSRALPTISNSASTGLSLKETEQFCNPLQTRITYNSSIVPSRKVLTCLDTNTLSIQPKAPKQSVSSINEHKNKSKKTTNTLTPATFQLNKYTKSTILTVQKIQNWVNGKPDQSRKINLPTPQTLNINHEKKKNNKQYFKGKKPHKQTFRNYQLNIKKNARTELLLNPRQLLAGPELGFINKNAQGRENQFVGQENCITPTLQPGEIIYKVIPILDYTNIYKKYIKINAKFDNKYRVTSIYSVRNPFTYNHYMETLRKASPGVKERMLYHGTAIENLHSILTYNFDWRKTKDSWYGFGVYFANNPWYASHYSKKHYTGAKMMIISKVQVGKSHVGTPTTIRPDEGYDTTTSEDGQQIVKYDDHTFYPQYIVYYEEK